jgi:hypothetical protein
MASHGSKEMKGAGDKDLEINVVGSSAALELAS